MKWQGNTLHGSEGSITIKVKYCDGTGLIHGWFAEYIGAAGDVIHHSEMASHPHMPKRRDARTGAYRIARSVARKLLKS